MRQPDLEPYAGIVSVEVLKDAIGFRKVKTMKALTDTEIFKNGEPVGSFSGVFGYRAPDSLRTSFFGPFGLTVLDVLVTRDLIQVSLPSKNILYQAQSPEASFLALDNRDWRYEIREEDDLYALYAYTHAERSSGLAIKYLFDRIYLLNRGIVIFGDGREAVLIAFEGFSGGSPEKVRVSLRSGLEMQMQMRDTEYDTDIPEEYFKEGQHKDKTILPLQELLMHFDLSP